jgi:hypothetical protein
MRGVRDIVSAVDTSPRRIVPARGVAKLAANVVALVALVALAGLATLGASGCAAGGPTAPPGFSTAFAPEPPAGAAPYSFHALDGTGAGNVWAVGEAGATVRLTGSTFTLVPTPSTASLTGVAAFDVSRAFAAESGGPNAFAWSDGTATWAPLGVPRAERKAAATWATATNDLWVAGDGIEHWDGTTWTTAVASGSSFAALSGSFGTDVWAVGAGGVQHYDGHAWTAVPLPGDAPGLTAVWTSSLFDTWIVGAGGVVLHWNGTNLARVTSETTKNLTSVSGSSPDDVWAGGQDGTLLHWNGASWIAHTTPTGRTIEDVWTAPGSAVLFVDGSGAVQRYVY